MPSTGHKLETRGIYGVIRNPSYFGLLITSLGWVLAFRSGVGVVLTASLLVPLVARIRIEERLLREHFGAEYAAYCARTWRLVPNLLRRVSGLLRRPSSWHRADRSLFCWLARLRVFVHYRHDGRQRQRVGYVEIVHAQAFDCKITDFQRFQSRFPDGQATYAKSAINRAHLQGEPLPDTAVPRDGNGN